MSTMEKSIYQIKLLGKQEVSKNMLEITFERPTNFDFLAGQFVQFSIPSGEKKLPRFYSICSSPSEKILRFCIKIVNDGVGSTFLFGLQTGESLEMIGPQGMFTVGEKKTPILCVATGAGIAPIISIIADQLERGDQKKINLIFGVRSQEDIFFVNYLEELAKNSNFSYQITLSRPNENQKWDGLVGRVTDHLGGDFVGHQIYLCGSVGMVRDVREILINKKIDQREIRLEIF